MPKKICSICPTTLDKWLLSDGIGNRVAVALTHLVASYGVGYIIAVAITNFVTAHRVHDFIAIASADLLGVCSTAAARTDVGMFAGAEQDGYEYVKEFFHFLMHHCRDVYIMIKDKTWWVSMLHIFDDFTVLYVREYLAFLFLRER